MEHVSIGTGGNRDNERENTARGVCGRPRGRAGPVEPAESACRSGEAAVLFILPHATAGPAPNYYVKCGPRISELQFWRAHRRTMNRRAQGVADEVGPVCCASRFLNLSSAW